MTKLSQEGQDQSPTDLVKAKDLPEGIAGNQSLNFVEQALTGILKTFTKSDMNAATSRVKNLRFAKPQANKDELVNAVIKRKTQQTAMVGAASSTAALIPGVGTLAALTLGTAADISATFKLQAEMVLEIAAIYEADLNEFDQQKLIYLVTGVSMGSNALLNKAGSRVTKEIAERYAKRGFAKVIPILGIAVSSGTNALATYAIASRAKAYFKPNVA